MENTDGNDWFYITMRVTRDAMFIKSTDVRYIDRPRSLGMQHDAFNYGVEYDPSWFDEFERSTSAWIDDSISMELADLLAFFRELDMHEHIWVIEPRLKPTEAFKKENAILERKAFRARGMRLVEIEYGDRKTDMVHFCNHDWWTGLDGQMPDRNPMEFWDQHLGEHLYKYLEWNCDPNMLDYPDELRRELPTFHVLGRILDE